MDYDRLRKVYAYLKKPLAEEILISLYKLGTKSNEITVKYFLCYYGFGIDVLPRLHEAIKLGLVVETNRGLFKDKYIALSEDGEKVIIGKIYMK